MSDPFFMFTPALAMGGTVTVTGDDILQFKTSAQFVTPEDKGLVVAVCGFDRFGFPDSDAYLTAVDPVNKGVIAVTISGRTRLHHTLKKQGTEV